MPGAGDPAGRPTRHLGPGRGDCARCGRGHADAPCCSRRGHGVRARKGWIRVAVLALLAERPMHGYEMITELAERTGGAWSPSPGSIYPTLQTLAEQGLVESEAAPAGDKARRRYTLTGAGRDLVASHDPADTPWDSMAPAEDDPSEAALRQAAQRLRTAADHILAVGTARQRTRAGQLLATTTQSLYGLLASDD